MKNIFVGNLDFNASEEGVRSLFERYGQVNSARIMTDRETGRSRGFAFVEMENEGGSGHFRPQWLHPGRPCTECERSSS